MFKFRNVIISVSLLLLVMLPLASCSVLDWVNNQNMVITTIEQIQDGKKGEAVILPTDKIPEEYRTSWKDKVVVMAPRESLKANSTLFVPMSSDSSMWGGDAIMSLAQGALSIGSTFIPQLAGFEAILLLLFKRKRKHYGNALKALAPTGQGINIKAASQSIGKALGMSHSSSGSGKTFDKEEIKAKTA